MTEPLLHELIEIPSAVHKSDFVLKLTEGVVRGAETVRDYVVTEALAKNFDHALTMIRGAAESRSSKAAYLHGSFGSGKSHFMAMLHLLLQHDPTARAVPELSTVVAKHSGWLQAKKFLLVPYHMIGARSFEQALVDGYLRTLAEKLPDAPLPAVFRAEALLSDAANTRRQFGDAQFFRVLNGFADAAGNVSAAKSGWGAFDAGWTEESYAAAAAAKPGSPERSRLVQALLARLFPGYSRAGGEDSYLEADDVLRELARHTKQLGYDALILFLDELILWLASHVADLRFIGREAQKVAKLVESGSPRPLPVVSFIARQRDLRDLIGDQVPGAEKLAFTDTLDYASGRFDTIRLEDRNLPTIAEKRLLRPKGADAKLRIDRAFEQVERIRDSVISVLKTRDGDRAAFRRLYPFSPALVNVLVAVSSALQRERTALRIMLQLLVAQRNRLRLGQLVPVGDLFDAITEGDDAFSSDMRKQFEEARKLWNNKLLPMLELEHGVRYEALEEMPEDDPRVRAFRGNERLLKTLLLAAMVPGEESMRDLTASRLHALNYGTIRTPIEGQEAQTIVNRMRTFATRVGEIRVGDGQDPALSVRLTGVDIEPILERAGSEETRSDRLRKIRETLYRIVGIPPAELLASRFQWEWRGTDREVDVVFGNVRELGADVFRADGPHWKIVIDYPFDEAGHSAKDDISRVDQLRASHDARGRTICWIPSFFSNESLSALGRLVRLDVILKEERFRGFTDHLSDADRLSAKAILGNLRSQLQHSLELTLAAAYGIATPPPRALENPLEPNEHLQALDPSFEPRPPVGADLRGAFFQLLDQMLAWQYPDHPLFERKVKKGELDKVLEIVRRAHADPHTRVIVEQPLRAVMREIAQPLQLGVQHESAFVLAEQWKNELTKRAAKEGGTLNVARLRRYLDDPPRRGLPREVQNLLILAYAECTGKAFVGARADGATIDSIDDSLELRDHQLPDKTDWLRARELVQRVFGIGAGRDHLTPQNAAALSKEIEDAATSRRDVANDLPTKLRRFGARLGLTEDCRRILTADDALRLIESLATAPDTGRIEAVARFVPKSTPEALARSIERAAKIMKVLEQDAAFDYVEMLNNLEDARADRAAATVEALRAAFRVDELVEDLEVAMQRFERDAIALVKESIRDNRASSPLEVGRAAPQSARVIDEGDRQSLPSRESEALLRKLLDLVRDPARQLDLSWRVSEIGSRDKMERES